jgi:drug/metabolite transporter (DMT)-like permease
VTPTQALVVAALDAAHHSARLHLSGLRVPHPHLRLPKLRFDKYLDQVHIPVVAIVESLAGAACYAASSILQQEAASEQPDEMSMRPGLLLRLVHSPRWMLGNVADAGGYVMQFLALRRGALALVSPLFVTGLAMSIIGSAFINHRRPTRREWVASLATVVGLGVFIAVAQPGPGHPRASTAAWSGLFLATAILAGGAVLLARGTRRRRALLLSMATGILYGVTSAVTEHTGYLLNLGFVHALTTWSPYVLAVISVVGLLVNQSAYQAGDLHLSLPLFTVLEPIVAILIGQFLFGEHVATAAGAVVGEVLGIGVMTFGVFWLAQAVPQDTGAPRTELGAA